MRALKIITFDAWKQAYREGIYGRRYQWIITGIYNEQWWRLDDGEAEELGCNEEELLLAIDGYIVTDVLTLSKNARTHNGFVIYSLLAFIVWSVNYKSIV